MSTRGPGRLDRIIAEARRAADERAQSYRELALKITRGCAAAAAARQMVHGPRIEF